MASISDDEKRLLSRLEDWLYLCDKRGAPCFSDFLDLREQAVLRCNLNNRKDVNWCFYGGYEDAERAVLAICPDYLHCEDVVYPFTPVAFSYRKTQKLSHRDFLGTLLSKGVRRDKIGDILCGDGLTVVFLSDEIVPYITEQVDRVGGEGVKVVTSYVGDLPVTHTYQEIRDTVASPRLDAVVKALIRVSREEAAHMIVTGLISVDHLPVENVSKMLTAPCTVSVRGYGRFLIDSFGPETKKGRLQFAARKCI